MLRLIASSGAYTVDGTVPEGLGLTSHSQSRPAQVCPRASWVLRCLRMCPDAHSQPSFGSFVADRGLTQSQVRPASLPPAPDRLPFFPVFHPLRRRLWGADACLALGHFPFQMLEICGGASRKAWSNHAPRFEPWPSWIYNQPPHHLFPQSTMDDKGDGLSLAAPWSMPFRS